MAERIFPAGAAPRVALNRIGGDVQVEVWGEPSIRVMADGKLREVYHEGDTLTIEGCAGDIELQVPAATELAAAQVDGDVHIEGVRRVELHDVGGDVELAQISETIALEKIGGSLEVTAAPVLRVGGRIEGDVELHEVGLAEIGQVSGDLSASGATALEVEQVDGNLSVSGPTERLRGGQIGGDCDLDLSASAAVAFGQVGGDLSIMRAAQVQVGSVGGDANLRTITGALDLGNVGGDLHIDQAASLRAGNVGGDGTLRGIGGNIEVGNLGGDLSLDAAFPPESLVRIQVGGDATVSLADAETLNMTLRAMVGGDVRGAGDFKAGERMVQLVYGAGSARCELQVGGDLLLRGKGRPGSTSAGWGEFGHEIGDIGRDLGREMSDLGRELSRIGQEIGREVSAAFRDVGQQRGSDWAEDVARTVEKKARQAAERAEELGRRAEQVGQQAADQAAEQGNKGARLRVQINDREWRLDPERLERIKDQARKAAGEGLAGAIEAVDRALGRIRAVPPVPPIPPIPPMPPIPPIPAVPPVPPVPPIGSAKAATGQTIKIEVEREVQTRQSETAGGEASPPPNPEQDREAILRMVAEGRISPEEGDMMLEMLG